MERKLNRIQDDQELIRQERREDTRELEASNELRFDSLRQRYERKSHEQASQAEPRRYEDRMTLREQVSRQHMQKPSQDASFRHYMAHLQGGQASFNARPRLRSRQQQVADQTDYAQLDECIAKRMTEIWGLV